MQPLARKVHQFQVPAGDQFTVADAYFFTVTGWAQFVGLDISELENIQAYRERILARPAVQAAMKAEGLLK